MRPQWRRTGRVGPAALPLLAACNTIEGVGKDVEAVGNSVSQAAEDVREDLEDEE